MSGSASLALFSEMVQEYGAMSYISFNAAIIMGTIETLMYAIGSIQWMCQQKCCHVKLLF